MRLVGILEAKCVSSIRVAKLPRHGKALVRADPVEVFGGARSMK